MKPAIFGLFIIGACLGAGISAKNPPATSTTSATWNQKAAAAYLDQRMVWWEGWKVAARDQGTFCISCHTALPYALARPSLRAAMGEQGMSTAERQLLGSVTKRVRNWKEMAPSGAEARGTESILNALILVSYDAPTGTLSPDARQALDNLWAEQVKTGDLRGAWNWDELKRAPWENESVYYGAALAALAVGNSPGDYATQAHDQESIQMLKDYLSRERAQQSLLNRLMLVDASVKMPGLLTSAEQKAILTEALSTQQADGGFRLPLLIRPWERLDHTPQETHSDGYATALVALVLEWAGTEAERPQLQRALNWLRQNQDQTGGQWPAYSMNVQRDLSTDIGKFMGDAATAYAVLALSQQQ